MTKNLIALTCALILSSFGAAAAAAEPTASSQPVQPSQAVAPPPVVPLLLSPAALMGQGACSQCSSSNLPAPMLMSECAGGEFGPCDDSFDCKGYYCPLGSVRYCWDSTGSGCEGWCGCCP